jgi:hypothetical protein
MALTTTPNPTHEEIRNQLPLHTGRISVALDEIVRRLQATLPREIAAHNAAMGYGTGRGVVAVKTIEIGPAVITDSFLSKEAIGKIFISASVESELISIGGLYTNNAPLSIYCIDAPIEVGQQMKMAFERIELIRGCLYPVASNCVDPRGRLAWKRLEPLGYSTLPPRITRYSGTKGDFRLMQPPNSAGLWDFSSG